MGYSNSLDDPSGWDAAHPYSHSARIGPGGRRTSDTTCWFSLLRISAILLIVAGLIQIFLIPQGIGDGCHVKDVRFENLERSVALSGVVINQSMADYNRAVLRAEVFNKAGTMIYRDTKMVRGLASGGHQHFGFNFALEPLHGPVDSYNITFTEQDGG